MRQFYKLVLILCLPFFVVQLGLSQELDWARNFGGTSTTSGQYFRSTIDNESNVICAGKFDGFSNTYLDFSQTVPSPAGGGMSVSKIDSSGNLIWLHICQGPSARDVIVLSDSSILVTGVFDNTVNFDPTGTNFSLTAFGNDDGFILKLSSTGQFEWVRQYAQFDADLFNVDVDDQDNIYAAMSFITDSVDCDPLSDSLYIYSSNNFGSYISKTTTNGDLLWVKQFEILSPSGYNKITDLKIHKNKILLGGTFKDSVNFDPSTSSQIYDSDTSQFNSTALFIVKMDTSGYFDWVKTFSGQESSTNTSNLSGRTFECLVVDSLENIYAMGNHISTIDFDPDPNQTYFPNINGTSAYGYILKLSPSGSFEWVNNVQIGGQGCVGCGVIPSTNQSLTVDNRGFLYWVGRGRNIVDFDPGVGTDIISLTASGMFLSKYDTDGNYVWTFTAPNLTSGAIPYASYFTSVSPDRNGNLFIGGHTVYKIDLDPSFNEWILNPPNGTSFIAKYTQDVCAEMYISLDSLALVSCAGNGYVASTLHHATPPFDFTWNGQPTVGYEVAGIGDYGLNHFYAIDSNGCEANKYALMDGPLYFSNFDLNVNIGSSSFRPGFDSFIHLNASNDGCIPQSGEIRLVLPPGITFNYSTLPPTTIIGDTLLWDFNSLSYDSGPISSLIGVSVSTLLQIGDTICLNAQILPDFGDANISNNEKEHCLPLINGYDPNDKQVYPEGKCEENYVSSIDPLTYMIRFQNTGNASAINIRIEDDILPTLDFGSIHILGSSHQMHVEVPDSNTIHFVFDNINLPDSTSDLAGSQGSLFFTIRPSSAAITGDVITNSAEIYFDFNPPIITNETFNTVYQGDFALFNCNLSVPLISSDEIVVYPNPTTQDVYFKEMNGKDVTSIEIFDTFGRLIKIELQPNQNSFQLHKSGLFLIRFFSHDEVIGIKKVQVVP